MATLVLTAVGSAISGPIGGAIGSIIGQQVDSILFAPKGREGPRLKELEVQTSSYGTQIPAIFGAMRVAGTVIWATDLIERRSKSGGGKGKPATSEYSYSVNMAIAISSMPVARIGRIWANGNLLRGAGGDFKVDTTFRFHNGHNDQILDPLIASAEAAANCPAYRGLAYAVFEDLQLADYGNRIPSLTFEIFERETAVPLNAIFQTASAGSIEVLSAESVTGYAMSAIDARTALSPLLDSFPVLLRTNADKLQLIDNWLPAAAKPSVEPVADDSGRIYERPTVSLSPAYTAPQKLTLRYYEPARDYQAGLQSSERDGTGRTIQHVELPVSLDARNAKRISELQLMQIHRNRESLAAQTAINSEQLSAGQWIADSAGRDYQIQEVEHFRGSTRISARSSLVFDPTVAFAASPGRNIAAPDLVPGQTQIAVIDMPVFDTTDPGKSLVGIFANGTGSGWRSAALSIRQGDSLIDIGPAALPAIIGHCVGILPPHSPYLLDLRHPLDVQLAHNDIAIGQITEDWPLCWIGGEFVRFGSVMPLAAGRYRLTNLQRGCYGTEAAVDGHQVGETFVWLEQSTARLLDGIVLTPGTTVMIEALGIGDDEPVLATASLNGKSIAPLSPVHAHGALLANGSVELTWVRRSRIDFGWADGVDQGLVEDGEQYLVSLLSVDGPITDWTVQASTLTISSATISDLTAVAGPVLTFGISQIGRHMASAAATVRVNIT